MVFIIRCMYGPLEPSFLDQAHAMASVKSFNITVIETRIIVINLVTVPVNDLEVVGEDVMVPRQVKA